MDDCLVLQRYTIQLLFPCQILTVFERLHWFFSVAIPSAVWPLIVIVIPPFVLIFLELIKRFVEFCPERNCAELLLHCSVQSFTNTIGLRRVYFRFAVFDALDVQIKLILMMFPLALVFCSLSVNILSN